MRSSWETLQSPGKTKAKRSSISRTGSATATISQPAKQQSWNRGGQMPQAGPATKGAQEAGAEPGPAGLARPAAEFSPLARWQIKGLLSGPESLAERRRRHK